MTRSVFFSFDYDNVLNANIVRNSGAFMGIKNSGFIDKAQFESVKKQGDEAIRNWIKTQMNGCSVTCVLIGQNTYKSRWVNFEIEESIKNGMGLLGVNLHKIQGIQRFGLLGQPINPMSGHYVPGITNMGSTPATSKYLTYDWVTGPLTANPPLGEWIEDAARRAGR